MVEKEEEDDDDRRGEDDEDTTVARVKEEEREGRPGTTRPGDTPRASESRRDEISASLNPGRGNV